MFQTKHGFAHLFHDGSFLGLGLRDGRVFGKRLSGLVERASMFKGREKSGVIRRGVLCALYQVDKVGNQRSGVLGVIIRRISRFSFSIIGPAANEVA